MIAFCHDGARLESMRRRWGEGNIERELVLGWVHMPPFVRVHHQVL